VASTFPEAAGLFAEVEGGERLRLCADTCHLFAAGYGLDRPDGGTARVDRRTKELLTRIAPGNIAVIDHEDLDRLSAEGLVEAGVGGGGNAARSISGLPML